MISILRFFYCCLFTTLCPTLCDPADYSPPGSSVHGILQARLLGWVAISSSRGFSWPRDQTHISCIAGRRFNLWATGEAPQRLRNWTLNVDFLLTNLKFTQSHLANGCCILDRSGLSRGFIMSHLLISKWTVGRDWKLVLNMLPLSFQIITELRLFLNNEKCHSKKKYRDELTISLRKGSQSLATFWHASN